MIPNGLFLGIRLSASQRAIYNRLQQGSLSPAVALGLSLLLPQGALLCMQP